MTCQICVLFVDAEKRNVLGGEINNKIENCLSCFFLKFNFFKEHFSKWYIGSNDSLLWEFNLKVYINFHSNSQETGFYCCNE